MNINSQAARSWPELVVLLSYTAADVGDRRGA